MKNLKKLGFSLLCLSLLSSVFCQESEEAYLLQFKQHKGDSVSHVATVEEEAYMNGYLNNRTQFINRTSTTIKDILDNKDASLLTKYMITQNSLLNSSGAFLSWGEEDSVEIFRSADGKLYDSNNAFLPTVQSVPSFPSYKVKPGDSWEAEGREVHDCKDLFSMDCAIEIPFTAKYTFSGKETYNDSEVFIINVYYELYQDAEKEGLYQGSYYAGTTGYAKEKIYWDNQRGDLAFYTEEFEITMYDIRGFRYTFHGSANGEVTEYKSLNDDYNLKKINDTVKELDLNNVSVKKGEKGLTISLDNIQFEPDSNVLLESEKIKLQKIGEILKEYSNDLLITGHCAERGSVKAREALSVERAVSVAEYLKHLGIRDEYHIFTEGKGSRQPIASNATEAGRAKNRRVEITLMD